MPDADLVYHADIVAKHTKQIILQIFENIGSGMSQDELSLVDLLAIYGSLINQCKDQKSRIFEIVTMIGLPEYELEEYSNNDLEVYEIKKLLSKKNREAYF